jgi:DNA mismatch repair protein MutS
MAELTPMMRQYKAIKREHQDAILFFRMGDFYEMFFDDAKEAAPILDIALTARQGMPMCGVPYHAAQVYLDRLLAAGKRVAVCDQIEDPKKARGVVKRAVTRVVTPGTVIGSETLPAKANNYIAAVAHAERRFGFAHLDVTTGEFRVIELGGRRELLDELLRVAPAECLLPESVAEREGIAASLDGLLLTVWTPLEDWVFDHDSCFALLTDHFRTHSLDGFGCVGMRPGVSAAGALLGYVADTLNRPLEHVRTLAPYSTDEHMLIDPLSLRNLEVIEPMRGASKAATLLGILDRTVTPMGGRLIAQWMREPLLEPAAIRERQSGVADLVAHQTMHDGVREGLRAVRDLERLITRIGTGYASPRDLVALKASLLAVPEVGGALGRADSQILARCRDALVLLDEVTDLIERAVVAEPPALLRDGGIFRAGYHAELDELRAISSGAKEWIAKLQEGERERTGIKSLKVGYNKVFGYYVEVSHANKAKVPDDYIRKQTLVNAERYITPELKELEAKVVGAEEKIAEIEQRLFAELREQVARFTPQVQQIARAVAVVDVLAAFAASALESNYARPEIAEGDTIEITDGRHPVVEAMMVGERFVPNSVHLDGGANQLLIVTGPNMAGKSTYIRQTALLVLMAQIGSFIPAKKATIGVVDRIFTRVGASDELARGQSTFMVEMNETANILNNATDRSLVILDEIGRGTSTYDGISIAWAVAEFIATAPGKRAKTLFATHFHELTRLAELFDCVKNYNVAVREWSGEIVFLRRIVPGGTDKSYGIHVADLAGLPEEVIERAKAILRHLEEQALASGTLGVGAPGEETRQAARSGKERIGRVKHPSQLFLFGHEPHPVVEELRALNLDEMAPVDALLKLRELKDKADK